MTSSRRPEGPRDLARTISNFQPPPRRKPPKCPLCRKVVKPPEPPNSRQATDSVAEINLKIWRVYPLGFASLEVEIKFGASFPACAFLLHRLLFKDVFPDNAQIQTRSTRTHSRVRGEVCPGGSAAMRTCAGPQRRAGRSGFYA